MMLNGRYNLIHPEHKAGTAVFVALNEYAIDAHQGLRSLLN